MGAVRNWKGVTTSPDEGQDIIHGSGWQNITVKRTITHQSRNVGVDTEMNDTEEVFSIKARIDPLERKLKTQSWIGLVELHILPMMKKGDHWQVEKPDRQVDEYRVETINGDEIILEKL
jgi:predicted amino acid dehydrogenase